MPGQTRVGLTTASTCRYVCSVPRWPGNRTKHFRHPPDHESGFNYILKIRQKLYWLIMCKHHFFPLVIILNVLKRGAMTKPSNDC